MNNFYFFNEKIANNISEKGKTLFKNLLDNDNEKNIKVIFLDIDGVLNYDKWYTSEEYQNLFYKDDVELEIDPACSERINKICTETNSKIVITSDWRISSWYGTIIRLKRGGINEDYILDKTPERPWFNIKGYDYSRGAEINDWLEQHPECTNYVIIDDREDFKEEQKMHFVHVNKSEGFTENLMEKALNILKY